MSSKKNSKEAGESPRHTKETQTISIKTEEKEIQTSKIPTFEKWSQTSKKALEEAEKVFKATVKSAGKEDKLKPIPSGDKDPQSTLQSDLTMQASQLPPPTSQKDDDSLIQQSPSQTSKKVNEEDKTLFKAAMKGAREKDKFKPVPSGDEDSESTLQSGLTMQATQLPPPTSQKDDETLIQPSSQTSKKANEEAKTLSKAAMKRAREEGKLKPVPSGDEDFQSTLPSDSTMQAAQLPSPTSQKDYSLIQPPSSQTSKKANEEAKTLSKAAMKRAREEGKLKLVPSGDEDPQSTLQLDLTMQAAQLPPPTSQKDDDSLIQQPSSQRSSQTNKEANEAKPLSKAAMKRARKQGKLKPVPPGDEDPQSTLQSDLTMQAAAQLSPPTSQKDDDSLIQQLSTLSISVQSDPPSLQPPPYSSQPDSESVDLKARKELCEKLSLLKPLRGIEDSQNKFMEFYLGFVNKLQELNLLDKIANELLAMNNDFDRIKCILQFEEIKNLNVTISNSKSEEYAKALEEEYSLYSTPEDKDETLKNKKLRIGLQLMNRCLQFTPGNTDEKTLAARLMKKSWANLGMAKYEAAREDAHRSLQYNMELSEMWNSYEVLGHSYAQFGENGAAETFFDRALEGLKISTVDQKTKAVSTTRIVGVYKFVKGRRDYGPKPPPADLVIPKVSYDINRILKCATDAVEVKISEKTGRGIYAKREIKPGDVIMVEKPFVSALNIDNFETHCNNCFKRLKTFIPCDTCSWVWFCSEECLGEGKAGFHSSECPVLNLLYEEGIGSMGIITFRIIFRLTWDEIKALRIRSKINTKLPDSDPLHMEFNRRDKYLSDDYLKTYKLVTNAQKRNFGDILRKTITAVYIKQCLKVVDFFEGENVTLNDEIFATSLILRHLQISSCNSISITEFIGKSSNKGFAENLNVGEGIYPTISLLNHICDPNVFRYCIGKDCVVRANRIIRKGEQLFDNYGALFEIMVKSLRDVILNHQFKFICDCIACKENWPTNEDNEVYMKLACPEENCDQMIEYNEGKEFKCPSCGCKKKHKRLKLEIEDKMKEFKQSLSLLQRGLNEKAADSIKYFQMYADNNFIPPSKCITGCQDILKTSYFLQGNVFESNIN